MRETDGYTEEQLQLEAMKEQIEQIAVPEEIDEAIRNGMRLGRQRRRRRRLTRAASYVACLLILASVASIRFSPTVAAYVGDIPGLRSLVELINYDKGLKLALENDYMQPVGLSEEHDGIQLKVDGIIADESRIIVFYTLNNMDGRKRIVNLGEVKLVNYEHASSDFGSSNFSEDWHSKQGTFEFNSHDEVGIPETLDLEIKVGEGVEASATAPVWKFSVPVDKTRFDGMKETYPIDQTVTVEGQRITFGKMTVYPSRVGLEVAYDPANTKKIFAFDDIRLEDELGETFGTITNGVSATTLSDGRQILYFQSNYFRKPNHLYLRASSIRALDKSKLEVKVDVDQKQLLSRPDDRMTLTGNAFTGEEDLNALVIRLKNEDPRDKNFHYFLFQTDYKDASGQVFQSNRMGSTTGEYQYYIKKANYKGPLTLTIADYPSRIKR
ncbi:DUF4179 domain-containing protein [Cohnella pontilimi]|nr:DUF4179 domain-containing protein [Cohnella pontilimi]